MKLKAFPVNRSPRADAVDRHRHDRPDHRGLPQPTEEQDGDEQHRPERQRHLPAQRRLRLARALELATPVERVARRQRHRLDRRADLREDRRRRDPLDHVALHRDRRHAVAPLDQRVAGGDGKAVDDLLERQVVLQRRRPDEQVAQLAVGHLGARRAHDDRDQPVALAVVARPHPVGRQRHGGRDVGARDAHGLRPRLGEDRAGDELALAPVGPLGMQERRRLAQDALGLLGQAAQHVRVGAGEPRLDVGADRRAEDDLLAAGLGPGKGLRHEQVEVAAQRRNRLVALRADQELADRSVLRLGVVGQDEALGALPGGGDHRDHVVAFGQPALDHGEVAGGLRRWRSPARPCS